jgi:hypothetical protein
MQSVLNLLGTKSTDNCGRATLNRRGLFICASAVRKRSLLSGRPSYKLEPIDHSCLILGIPLAQHSLHHF